MHPLDLSTTKDIVRMKHLLDTIPSPQRYFADVQQAVFAWENWEASDMRWRNDPRGGPLDHAFAARDQWQRRQALAMLQKQGSADDPSSDVDIVEKLFGDKIYTSGPDSRLPVYVDLDGGQDARLPKAENIHDIRRYLVQVLESCISLRQLQWSALLYPLPQQVADTLDRLPLFETLVLTGEGSHSGT